jgi:hypothetical protein
MTRFKSLLFVFGVILLALNIFGLFRSMKNRVLIKEWSAAYSAIWHESEDMKLVKSLV